MQLDRGLTLSGMGEPAGRMNCLICALLEPLWCLPFRKKAGGELRVESPFKRPRAWIKSKEGRKERRVGKKRKERVGSQTWWHVPLIPAPER